MTTLRPMSGRRQKRRGSQKSIPWQIQNARGRVQRLVSQGKFDAAHALAVEHGWPNLVVKPENQPNPINPPQARIQNSDPKSEKSAAANIQSSGEHRDKPSAIHQRWVPGAPRPAESRASLNRQKPKRRRQRPRFVPPPLQNRFRAIRATTRTSPNDEDAVGEFCDCGIWVAAGSEALHECP